MYLHADTVVTKPRDEDEDEQTRAMGLRTLDDQLRDAEPAVTKGSTPSRPAARKPHPTPQQPVQASSGSSAKPAASGSPTSAPSAHPTSPPTAIAKILDASTMPSAARTGKVKPTRMPTQASGIAHAPSIAPLPYPDFEPSVIAEMPVRPVPTAPAVPSSAVEPAGHGHVIAMFSCRGGAGTTTLAVNTAAELAKAGKSVCLVDLDLQLGDVFVALDLEAQTSLAAIAREASTIDGAALKRRLARHPSGVYAVSQASHLDDIDPQLVERLPALMATLSSHFDYVIVDGIRDLGDYALGVLDIADEIAMVLTQDVPSVRRAARALSLFRRLGYGENRIRLVLNRAGGHDIDEAAICRALGLPIAARIRNEHKPVRRALNAGTLISAVAPNSKLMRDIEQFAALFFRGEPGGSTATGDATEASAAPKVKRSLFSFLRRGAK